MYNVNYPPMIGHENRIYIIRGIIIQSKIE